jgi:hypothetical protein
MRTHKKNQHGVALFHHQETSKLQEYFAHGIYH